MPPTIQVGVKFIPNPALNNSLLDISSLDTAGASETWTIQIVSGIPAWAPAIAAFADLTGRWDLSQVDNTGAPGTFLRADGTWAAAASAFGDLTGTLAFGQRPPGGSTNTFFCGDGSWKLASDTFAIVAGAGISIASGIDIGTGLFTWTIAIDSTVATKSYANAGDAATLATAEAYTDSLATFAASTYATKAALTGAGYFKGAGSFPPSFSATVPVSDLLNSGGATGDLLVGSSTSLVRLVAVASGQVLASAGTSTAPTYTASPSLTALTLSGLGTVGSLRVTGLSTGIGHYDGSGNLTSSTIIDADVSSSAAVAGTKISPDFGSQDINTASNYKQQAVSGNNKNYRIAFDVDATTTDATLTTVFTLTPPANCVVRLGITIDAAKSDASASYGCDMVSQFRVSSGTVTSEFDGTPANIGGSLGVGTVSVTTNGTTIAVKVTGIASTTISWGGFGQYTVRTNTA